MGLLVDGGWVDRWYDTSVSAGRFIRRQSAFRNWITPNERQGRPAAQDSRQSWDVTTSTFRWRARGLIEL